MNDEYDNLKDWEEGFYKDPSILKSMGTRKVRLRGEAGQKYYREVPIFNPYELSGAIYALTDLVVRHYPEEENHPDIKDNWWCPRNLDISPEVEFYLTDFDMFFGTLKDGVRMYEARYGEIGSCPAEDEEIQEIRKKFAKKIGDM